MKKIVTLLILVFALSSCSSSDNSNNNSNIDEVSMKFEVADGLKFTSKIPNSELNQACLYSSYLNNNGSKTHTLSSFVNRFGDNPLFLQDGISFEINFTTSADLQVNQIVQINGINSFSVFLPYSSDGNYSQTSNFCNSLQLEQNTTSAGYIKITQITDDYVYGEFQFNNLLNVGGTSMLGSICPNYPNQQNYNILNGTFQALK